MTDEAGDRRVDAATAPGHGSAPVEFWFDFSSGYAYFAAFEIDALAARHGRTVRWRPFMLGTAFRATGAQGLSRTPLKKDYAARDWQRIARATGLPFALPRHHGSIALPAARAFHAIDAADPAAAVRFAKAVFTAYFRDGLDTGDAGAVADLAAACGHDRAAILRAMEDPAIKALLRELGEGAVARGVFGSPWFFVDGEPFWGWDRLPMLDRWLATGGW